MTTHGYFVRGCTAFLDVIGNAIHHIGHIHKYGRRKDVPDKILVIITTNGMENASRYYTYDQVCHMIKRQKNVMAENFFFLVLILMLSVNQESLEFMNQ